MNMKMLARPLLIAAVIAAVATVASSAAMAEAETVAVVFNETVSGAAPAHVDAVIAP